MVKDKYIQKIKSLRRRLRMYNPVMKVDSAFKTLTKDNWRLTST